MSIRIWFTPSICGFSFGDERPNGEALEVSQNDYEALFAVQATGKIIRPHPVTGYPENADPPPPSDEELWANFRWRRAALLAASDWTQAGDAGGRCDQAAWAAYRQALCDIPQNQTDPANLTLPVPPA